MARQSTKRSRPRLTVEWLETRCVLSHFKLTPTVALDPPPPAATAPAAPVVPPTPSSNSGPSSGSATTATILGSPQSDGAATPPSITTSTSPPATTPPPVLAGGATADTATVLPNTTAGTNQTNPSTTAASSAAPTRSTDTGSVAPNDRAAVVSSSPTATTNTPLANGASSGASTNNPNATLSIGNGGGLNPVDVGPLAATPSNSRATDSDAFAAAPPTFRQQETTATDVIQLAEAPWIAALPRERQDVLFDDVLAARPGEDRLSDEALVPHGNRKFLEPRLAHRAPDDDWDFVSTTAIANPGAFTRASFDETTDAAALGLSPEALDQLLDRAPAEAGAIDRALASFLDQLNALGAALGLPPSACAALAPWLLTGAALAVAAEAVRRKMSPTGGWTSAVRARLADLDNPLPGFSV